MKRLTHFFGGPSPEDNKQPAHVGVRGPPTPPTPQPLPQTPPPLPPLLQTPNRELLGLPQSPESITVGGRQNPPRLSISLPSPGHTRTIQELNETLTPPVSGTANPTYGGGLSPSHYQPLPLSNPSSPIASPGGGARNFSGASYASFATTNVSRPNSSQNFNSNNQSPAVSEVAKVPRKKRNDGGSAFFGRKKKSGLNVPTAWRLNSGSGENLDEYDFGSLIRGEPVRELWDPQGDTLVFLTPNNIPNPKFTAPSFRISSSPLLFSALGQYVEDTKYRHDSFDEAASPGASQLNPNPSYSDIPAPELPREASTLDQFRPEAQVMYKVYFPALELAPRPPSPPTKGKKYKQSSLPANDMLQPLMDARNLFAFLSYQFLVATLDRETPFQILQRIYEQLQRQASPTLRPEGQADQMDQSRMSRAEMHLLHYVDTLSLDDIRNDDDMIVEALILAERWKCVRLYREGFVHAAGRWERIKLHPGFGYVSEDTKSRLDRSSIDLHQVRLQNVETFLTGFLYPSMWSGSGKYAEFKLWRAGFEAMRKVTLNYYKHVFGSWPPRAGRRGKGGGYTETGGLNRLVLRRVYKDFCAVYDLLVDREWIHGERIHFDSRYAEDEEEIARDSSRRTAMRKILDEFNHSHVPVQPPIPFDTPRAPRLPPTPSDPTAASKKPKTKSRRLKNEELVSLLQSSYNQDVLHRRPQNELVDFYIQLERDSSKGRTIEEIAEIRCGRWSFIYCVLQSLPMTVIDAHGCVHGKGVEYFLCENLKGMLPWETKDNRRTSRLSGIWMPESADPQTLVGPEGQPQALLGTGDEVEDTYCRSHCWTVSEEWRMFMASDSAAQPESDDAAYQAFERQFLDGIREDNGGARWSPDMSPIYGHGTELSRMHNAAISNVIEQLRNYDQVPVSPGGANYSPAVPHYAPPSPPPRLITGTTPTPPPPPPPRDGEIPETHDEFVKYRKEHMERFQTVRKPLATRLSTEDPAGSPSLVAQKATDEPLEWWKEDN